MRDSTGFVFCRHYTKAAESRFHIFTLTLSPSDGEREISGGNGEGRTNRFRNHSLAGSKLKREGLKAGTPAPDFSLPRLDGRGDLALGELRGKHVLLVFSSPHCGPCNTLAPQLEKFHRGCGTRKDSSLPAEPVLRARQSVRAESSFVD